MTATEEKTTEEKLQHKVELRNTVLYLLGKRLTAEAKFEDDEIGEGRAGVCLRHYNLMMATLADIESR